MKTQFKNLMTLELITVEPSEVARYEADPGFQLYKPALTHCAICSRNLRDAASVQIGIGPDCRERVEFEAVPESIREQANALIYEVASNLSDMDIVLVAAAKLRTLGLHKLAVAMVARFSLVTVTVEGSQLFVASSYNPDANVSYRTLRGRWNPAPRKAWSFASSKRAELYQVLAKHFPGGVLRVKEGEKTTDHFLPGGAAHAINLAYGSQSDAVMASDDETRKALTDKAVERAEVNGMNTPEIPAAFEPVAPAPVVTAAVALAKLEAAATPDMRRTESGNFVPVTAADITEFVANANGTESAPRFNQRVWSIPGPGGVDITIYSGIPTGTEQSRGAGDDSIRVVALRNGRPVMRKAQHVPRTKNWKKMMAARIVAVWNEMVARETAPQQEGAVNG